jgi:2'-phosphotransferase
MDNKGLPKKQLIKLSKTLSYLLRHGAHKEGLPIRSDGFVKINDVLNTPQIKQFNFTQGDILEAVQKNNKKRFVIKKIDGLLYIKATQGHSIELKDLALKPVKSLAEIPTRIVVHGTYMKHWPSIKTQGLCRMKRNHIHFAIGEYGSNVAISGLRNNCEVLIYIDLDAAIQDGIEFFFSENNVVLSSGVNGCLAPKYFKYVLDARTGQPFDPDFPHAPPRP